MNAKAKREMLARAAAIDDELVRPLYDRVVAISRDVPDDDFVTFLDDFATEFHVFQRGTAHVDHRRLPADDLRDRVGHESRVGTQFPHLVGELAQSPKPAG